MKLAINGTGGFVGRNLLPRLNELGIDYELFDSRKHNLLDPDTLKDFVAGKDVILHMATKNRNASIEEMIKTNVLGMTGMVEALARFNPSAKLIYTSSILAHLKDNLGGVTKKIAEDIILQRAQRAPINAVILRFSNMYGEHGTPFHNSVIATILYQIEHGQTIQIRGDGSQKRDHLHIRDGVDAILKAINYDISGVEIFDICTGKLTSLNRVLEILRKYCKKPIYVRYNRKAVVEKYNLKIDFSEAQKTLGWEPKINIEAGLKMLAPN